VDRVGVPQSAFSSVSRVASSVGHTGIGGRIW
jgi:hypothetical protein